jgi:hypothetical protein
MNTSIRGLQEAQRAILKTIAAVKPTGALGRAVLYLAIDAYRTAVALTHVDTGALRASHNLITEGDARYRIAIRSGAYNPRTRALTSKYGPAEHGRGGSHAFYQRTYDRGGEMAANAISRYLVRELP